MLIVVPRSELPAGIEPQVGQELVGGLAGGGQMTVVITEVTDSSVTVDANHPLAGKDLTFDIELVDIS
jgi:peptidylprolyl isomerase